MEDLKRPLSYDVYSLPIKDRIKVIKDLYDFIILWKHSVDKYIETADATFRGVFTSLDDLLAVEADNNDFAWLKTTDEHGNVVYKHYHYVAPPEDEHPLGWTYDYSVVCAEPYVDPEHPGQAGLMSPYDKKKLDDIEEEARANVIEGVKVNGTLLNPDDDKEVDITITEKTGVDEEHPQGTNPNGTIVVNGVPVPVKGLQSAAFVDATEFANAIRTAILGDASTDFNTLGKIEDFIEALINKIGTLVNVNDFSTWTNDGVTELGEGILWPTGNTTATLQELMVLTVGDDPGFSPGALVYVLNGATFDGESLLALYYPDGTPMDVSMKISAARSATIEENFLQMEQYLLHEAQLLADDAKAFATAAVDNATHYKDVYIGTGAAYSDAMDAANHHDSVRMGAKTSVTVSNSYLWVILPATYTPTVTMNGYVIPMTAQANVTVSDVAYKVLKSDASYSGSFDVILL